MELLDNQIVADIKTIISTSRENVVRHMNNEMILAYWQIGKRICQYEQEL